MKELNPDKMVKMNILFLKMKDSEISQTFFLLGSCIACLFIYLPSMKGTPIWDDAGFWFFDPTLMDNFSYSEIWKNYVWPLTVSYQKMAFAIWGSHFQIYHVVSLFFHFMNSLLLYKLAVNLKLTCPKWIFLFFLLHPANVISVAWMIQIKTLLCFFFSILSFSFLNNGLTNKKWIPLSWISFLLSILSKSASITLPFVFLIYAFSKLKTRSIFWIFPFFLITAWGTSRLLNSEVTIESIKLLPESPSNVQVSTNSNPLQKIRPVENKTLTTSYKSFLGEKLFFIIKTSKYYLWHTIIPFKNHPIKGIKDLNLDFADILNLIFLIAVWVFSKESRIILVMGHLLLVPFLGIFPAPYMNVTWVSDQHLYLALPFFLIFWIGLIKKKLPRFSSSIALILSLLFIYKTYQANFYYLNEVKFFSTSLEAEPTNIPVAFNLAETYMANQQYKEARKVIDDILKNVETMPEVKGHKFLHLIYEQKSRLDHKQKLGTG